jgi:PAS domain S-box-containing protein
MAHRQKKRCFNLQVITAVIAAILVVGYVSFLLVSHYRSQVDLQKNLLKQLKQESEKQALAVGYFFTERKDDLVNLALSREVAVFFENKDLGMSMEYGLKLSLIPIRDRLIDLVNRKSLNGAPIYSRILLIDNNGQVLVDSATGKNNDKSVDGKELLIQTEKRDKVLSSADGREIMVSVPYIFKNRYVGQVVGWIRPEIFYKNLLREGTTSQRYTYLVIEKAGTYLSVGAPLSSNFLPPNPGQLTLGEVKHFETKEPLGQAQKWIALRLLIKNTPFSIIIVSDATAVLGTLAPSQILFRLGILTLAILGGAIFVFYLSFKILLVRTHLEESVVRERGVKEENRKLEIEMAERRRVEEALRENEANLRIILESVFTGILVIDPETHLIVDVNPVGARLIGEPKEKIVGNVCHEYICPAEKGKCPVSDLGQEVDNSERILKCSDGETCPIIKTVVPINFNGRKHLLESFVDITELKRTEEALKESEKRYRDLMEEAPIGLGNVDVEGKILYINRRLEEISHYSREELVGKNILTLDLFSSETQEKLVKRLMERLSGAPSVPMEIEVIQKDEGIKCLEIEARLIKNQGITSGFQVAVNDITARRRAQEELLKAQEQLEKRVQERTADLDHINENLRKEIIERKRIETNLKQAKTLAEMANRAKSEFLANMSHELRTPLNHIIGFNELVLSKKFGPLSEVQEEFLNDVLSSSHHLLSLINDVLDLSKVEAGRMKLDLAPFALKPLLDNSLTMVKEKSHNHGIKLQTEFGDLPDTLVADERKLKQILYNLLSNAVKFTPNGGSVTLTVHPLNGSRPGQVPLFREGEGSSLFKKNGLCIEFIVSDTGIGLKSEDLERIFNPFEQADNSASRKYQGTGLGLSLTKKMVELHGGQIWATSAGEGLGAGFHFILPVRPPQENKSGTIM